MIQNTIQINANTTKKTLQQRKYKKYIYLKHNPKPSAKATDLQEDNKNCVQPSYTEVTARASLKIPSLTSTNSKPNNKNTHEKLRSSSPSNRFHKQRISPSCRLHKQMKEKTKNIKKKQQNLKKKLRPCT